MSDFQSMPSIITIAIKEGKRHRDCSHNHNRDMSTYAERLRGTAASLNASLPAHLRSTIQA